MKKSILIIDDEKAQAEGLHKFLGKNLPKDYHVFFAYEENDIIEKVENTYYSMVVLDLRMDSYNIDGIKIAQKIIDTNPFAKIVLMSAFKAEYLVSLKEIILSGKVIDTIDKTEFIEFATQVQHTIEKHHDKLFSSLNSIQEALLNSYAECKNEIDTFKKGMKFESFVSLLFNNIGFNNINKRVIDESRNEVDLIVRNDINDKFLEKFGKYFLIECKNIPASAVDKNMFIVFSHKLEHTANMSEFGVIATTGNFTKTSYIEAVRESGKHKKIIFLSNIDFEEIITSDDRLEAFKKLIDKQVKDN